LSRRAPAAPTFRKLRELQLYPASVCPTSPSLGLAVESTVRLTPGGLPPLELRQEIDARVVDKLAEGRLLQEIAGTLVEANDVGFYLPIEQSADENERLKAKYSARISDLAALIDGAPSIPIRISGKHMRD
jgi:hypothetical protein